MAEQVAFRFDAKNTCLSVVPMEAMVVAAVML
jgi:hypothetical protein